MSKIIFKFNNLDQEIGRVFRAVQKLDFYKKNNYEILLPQIDSSLIIGIKHNKLDKKDEKIFEQIIADGYNSERYKEKFNKIKEDWAKLEKEFFKNAEKLLKIKPLKEYICNFTQYGVGGSYHPPANFVVNIATCKFPFKTITHEIMHLMIHDMIEKNKIEHWQKERIVDLYMKKIFKDYKMQKIKDTKEVDEKFNKTFQKGAESVIKNINI